MNVLRRLGGTPLTARQLSAGLLVVAALGGCSAPGPPAGDADKGAQLFTSRRCATCHSIGKGKKVGPDLAGVTERYSLEELRHWIAEPESVYAARGRRPINPGFSPMARVELAPDEIEALVGFLSRVAAAVPESPPATP